MNKCPKCNKQIKSSIRYQALGADSVIDLNTNLDLSQISDLLYAIEFQCSNCNYKEPRTYVSDGVALTESEFEVMREILK